MVDPDLFTIVVALDAAHLPEFRMVLPTWLRHKPELAKCRWLFVCDSIFATNRPWWLELQSIMEGISYTVIEWSQLPDKPQRERMLTALVHAAEHVETPYYIKIDTDAVATSCPNWIEWRWLGSVPAIIAPPWGYTKPASMLDDLDTWSRYIGLDGPKIKRKPGERNKAFHRRVISYVMIGSTQRTKEIIKLLNGSIELPVPSQDTFLFYCAARLQMPIVYARFPGWKHVGGGGSRLFGVVQEAMK